MLSFFQNAFQFSLVIALSIVFPRQLVLAQTKDTTRVDTFAIALKRFSIEITNLKAQADTSAQRFDRQLKDLEKNLVSAKDPQRLKILEERIRILEEKNKANDEWKSQLLRRRYEFALQAHDKMIQGVTYVKSLSQFVGIEQKINLQTNPWSDSDFRDFWERLKDYAPLFGLTGMGATYLINNEAKPTTLAVIGVSAMFTPKLLKILGLGADKADTIRQKIAFLAFTRNAFDELESRSQEIREIFASDSVFLDTLKSLRAEFQSSPLSDSAYSMRIYQVQVALQTYTGIESQIPKYLERTKISLSKYQNHPQLSKTFASITSTIDQFLVAYEQDYSSLTRIPIAMKKAVFSPE